MAERKGRSGAAGGGRGVETLRNSPMMAHLLDALQDGTDIGHYGRLTFAMIARHFVDEDALVELLAGQPDFGEEEARSLVEQVQVHDYNPPRRERILEWQARQDFQICPDTEDPQACNVYRELQFPDDIYENIGDFWEEKAQEGERTPNGNR